MDGAMNKVAVKKSKIEKLMVSNPYSSGGTKKCINNICNADIPASSAGCPYCGSPQRRF
tara:strand:+ start:1466 stop:1642 length:177 start_codon:yes stop_codon:yes gene_type:complete